MKTFLTTIALAFSILISGFSAQGKEFSTANAALDHYISSIFRGSQQLDAKMLSDDFEMTILANDSEFKYNKRQLVKFLKQTKGLVYNCETAYEILDASGHCTIAKISLQFDGFTRVDFVTLCQEKGNWKISKIVSTYPQD